MSTPDRLAQELRRAVHNNDVKSLATLIRLGADIHAPLNSQGETALHRACSVRWGDADDKTACITALIDAGADVNAKTPEGHYTPLHAAAISDFPEAIDLLIAAGADIEARTVYVEDNDSTQEPLETPLMMAVSEGCDKALDVLLRHGAVMQPNGANHPLYAACSDPERLHLLPVVLRAMKAERDFPSEKLDPFRLVVQTQLGEIDPVAEIQRLQGYAERLKASKFRSKAPRYAKSCFDQMVEQPNPVASIGKTPKRGLTP